MEVLESVQAAHQCSIQKIHLRAKAYQTPAKACSIRKSAFFGPRTAVTRVHLGGSASRGTSRVPAESTKSHTAPLASQVQPLAGGLSLRKDTKGVSAAQVRRSKVSQNESDGEGARAQIRALISRVSQVKNGWEETTNGGGIQPSREVKERTDGILHRLVTLQQYADQHAGPDGGVPVQVTATMKALQRELGSLESIVRSANDSGATTTRSKGEATGLVPSSFPSKPPLPMVAVKDRRKAQPMRSQELQHESVERGPTERERGRTGHKRNRPLSAGAPAKSSDYAVSAAAGKVASPLAAFREEIERRVIELLSSKLRQQAPKKVDRSVGPGQQGGPSQASPMQKPLWIEEDDWAWSGESILDTGLADRRKAEFDLGTSESPRVESSFSASTSGTDTWKHTQYVKGEEIVRQQKISAMEDAIRTAESERMKLELRRIEAELKSAESGAARERVKELESKVRQLELELSRSVPLSIHDEVVKKLQGTVSELRGRIRELEGFVRERESMITTVSNNLIAERDAVVKKLTSELAKRVTPDEVDRAVASAVGNVRAELAEADEEVRRFASSLERREEELGQRLLAWEEEKCAVKYELDATIRRMVAVESTVDKRRAEVLREQMRAVQLERELAWLMEERSAFMAGAVAEKEALLQQVAMLERSLIASEVRSLEPPVRAEARAEASVVEEQQAKLISTQQEAAESKAELERVRFELKGLMKVAEAGQVASVLRKVADLLVEISKEGRIGAPPGLEWEEAVGNVSVGEVSPGRNEIGEQVVGKPEDCGVGLIVNGSVSATALETSASGLEQVVLSPDRRLPPAAKVTLEVSRAGSDFDGFDSDTGYLSETDDEEEEEAAEQPPAEEGEGPSETEVAVPLDTELRRALPEEAESQGIEGLVTRGESEPTTETSDGEDGSTDISTVTLFYETGWDSAYVHCSVDGQSWTEPPGLQMVDAVSPKGLPVKMLQISAMSLEFVLTNGNDDWDQPGHGGNYRLDHSGTFSLSSGNIVAE